MKHLRSWSVSTFLIGFIHIFIVLGSSKLRYEQGFESLLQLPLSRPVNSQSRPKRVLFLSDLGAKGDGISNDTEALINAWRLACSFSKRTSIVIPAGSTYLIHPINLGGPCSSKVILKISGTIIAPKDPDAWSGLNPRKWLYIHEVNHLTLEGGGTIDGMGQEWWDRSCKINSSNPCGHAPTAITFHKCKNLKVRKLLLVNSPRMHMAFTNCMRVSASHLQVIAPAGSPNTDGIHISTSKSVELKESMIGTGDDCISIVGNSTQIKIRQIACGPGHGISIGSLGKSKTWSQVHDVLVDGAFLYNTNNGVRIKTWQGGRGIVSKITFQNLLMENVSNPIIIDQYYCDSQRPCLNQTLAVKVKNISFIHINGTSATGEVIKFACSDNFPCEGLYLEDIRLVSYNGQDTTSFCWEAYGSSWGLVDPPACFPFFEYFIRNTGLLNSGTRLLLPSEQPLVYRGMMDT